MDISVKDSLRGGTWLFLGSITVSLTGLLFWLIISRLSGAGSIGVASSVFSSAAIASTLVSAGINIGVVREVAAHGQAAVSSALLTSLFLGLASSMVALPLCLLLGYSGWLLFLAAIYSGLNVLLTTVIAILQGLTRFKQVFLVSAGASLSKLFLGSGLAVLGLGALSAVAGFTAYAVVGALLGLTLIGLSKYGLTRRFVRDILRLGYANYPMVLSSQLVVVLAVYLFALISGSSVDTGRLYISLMIATAVSGLAGSVLAASLPIGTSRSTDPYSEAYRLSYGITLPVVVALTPLSPVLLGLVNPDLIPASPALSLLLATTPSMVMATAVQVRLNRYGERSRVALIGVARLSLLVILGSLLAGRGVIGVATAYSLSTIASAIMGLPSIPGASKTYIVYQSTAFLPLLLSSAGIPLAYVSAASLAVALAVQQATGIMTYSDYLSTMREITGIIGLARTSR